MLSLKTIHIYALPVANLMVLAADLVEVVASFVSTMLGA